MNQTNILIFSVRALHNAPRIIREIDILKDRFTLFTVGETKPTDEDVYFENIYKLRSGLGKIINKISYALFKLNIIKGYTPRFSKLENFIKENNIEILIIHEPVFLPLACELKKKCRIKIVFNAHEYHPLEFEDQPNWLDTTGLIYDKLYRNYLPKLDLFVNVCHGIAQKCLTEYQAPSIVIPNAAFYSNIPIYNKEGDKKIKIIYHGAILESRKIEEMIKVAELLGDDYVFDIMGTSTEYNKEYFQKLLDISSNVSNVSFIKPVSFNEIIPVINQYDIGIYILNPNGFNNEHALPNKLFEYIQAKLAIAISPSIEMKAIVEKYNLGIVAEDYSPESMAKKIKSLTKAEIIRFKKYSEIASKIENAEKYKELYLSHMQSLLN